MELNLTPDVIKKTVMNVVLFTFVALGVYALMGVLPGGFLRQRVETSDDVRLGADAAVVGIEAVFTLDHEESEADWLARICAVSTETGCDMVETFFAPSITAMKVEAEAKTGISADALRMVDSGEETDGVADEETVAYSWEVWEVAVTLDNPWSGAEQMNNLFVQVSNEEGAWKFARILFDDEAQRYAEEKNDVQ